MQETRQRILDYLDHHGSASASQLAKSFGMTAANLRRHLRILETRGLVFSLGLRPAEGRGRPEHLYTLQLASSADLETLTRALLHQLDKDDNQIEGLAKQILGDAKVPTGQISQRLVAAIRRLEPLGYKPRWEARPQGPQMVLGRCPYALIIADHPELCRMDANMLDELLGAEVEQTAKLQPGPQKIPQCVFVLRHMHEVPIKT